MIEDNEEDGVDVDFPLSVKIVQHSNQRAINIKCDYIMHDTKRRISGGGRIIIALSYALTPNDVRQWEVDEASPIMRKCVAGTKSDIYFY